MKTEKKIYTIETTDELRLNVQKVECTINESRVKDEICLLVSGCNADGEVVEEYVTMTLSEARKFSRILYKISN